MRERVFGLADSVEQAAQAPSRDRDRNGEDGGMSTGKERYMPRLLLSRRVDESIFIGDDIKITLVSVNGKSARIAIEAPTDVCVDREEIRELRNAERE